MARKKDGGKSRARGRGRGGTKRRAAGGRVAGSPPSKRPAKPSPAPAPARPAAAPKVKFKGRMLENEPLARHTTWRVGGPARYLLQPAGTDDVVRSLEFARARELPWMVMGLGSNLLAKDGGFPGLVIKMGKGMDHFEMKGATAIVGAGMPTPILARRTAEAGFVGVERFRGIPGTVGGGVVMNAGAHGAEFAEIVTEVTVMDANANVRTLPRRQISYKYRASNLEGIVLEAKLALGEEDPAKLKEIQERLLRWRKAKTPFDDATAGSTFKNPSGTKSAGTLIEEAGLKGFRVGGALVSPMHANYFVNSGTATGSDMLKLIEHVRKTVQKKLGVELELEVKVVGG